MNKVTTALIVIVVILLGVWLFVSFDTSDFNNHTGKNQTEEETTTTKDQAGNQDEAEAPEDWELYSNAQFDFTFMYPPKAKTSVEAGRVKVQFLGPDNEQETEITDGFSLYIMTKESAVKTTLRQFAEARFKEEAESNSILQEPQEISVGGKPAFRFEVQNQLGSTTTFVIFKAGSDTVFVTSRVISGDEDGSYEDMVNSIIDTLTCSSKTYTS